MLIKWLQTHRFSRREVEISLVKQEQSVFSSHGNDTRSAETEVNLLKNGSLQVNPGDIYWTWWSRCLGSPETFPEAGSMWYENHSFSWSPRCLIFFERNPTGHSCFLEWSKWLEVALPKVRLNSTRSDHPLDPITGFLMNEVVFPILFPYKGLP